MTPQEIQSRTFLQTEELMRTVPGITFVDVNSFSSADRCPMGWTMASGRCERNVGTTLPPAMVTRSGAATPDGLPCLPSIYLDGQQVQTAGQIGSVLTFDLATLPASQILALEVFRGASEVPVQYGGGSSACGVVLIWTVARLPVEP